MNNTVVVEVERLVVHPIYKKRVKKTSRFLCHTEDKLNEGTLVEIVETAPISKMKKFKVSKVLEAKEVKK